MERPPSQEKRTALETPGYWQENIPFKSPKKYFELQLDLAKLIAERTAKSLPEAIAEYAPVIQRATHELDKEGNETNPIPGLTEDNILQVAWETSVKRNEEDNNEPTPYHKEGGSRFGCHYYDYDESSKTINIHFFNAEFEEDWEDGKDMSKGPLDSSKIERRRHELKDMFKDIKARFPEAERVRCQTSLNNLDSYIRLFPESYQQSAKESEIDYDSKLWSQGTTIWGQFLGGKERKAGEYGFKADLGAEFLKRAEETPIERLADALPNPPRTAEANIQDFYELYGIK